MAPTARRTQRSLPRCRCHGHGTNWRARFAEDGLVKFGQVREGRGRKPSIPDATIEKIVTLTKEYRPEGETHWSTRTMAGVAGVSKSSVQRVWKELGLKPHRVDTFKVSNDPRLRRSSSMSWVCI